MKIVKVKASDIDNNTYLVFKDGRKDALVIDPSYETKKIEEAIMQNGLTNLHILITHGHIDHFASSFFLQESYRAPLTIHRLDEDKLLSPVKSYAMYAKEKYKNPYPSHLIEGEYEEFEAAGFLVKAIHVPGHSKGGVCYIIEDCIFTGDTLFAYTYGRYDFYDGSFDELYDSIKNKLFSLEGNYNVYPGHEDYTTLDFERENNQILTDYKH